MVLSPDESILIWDIYKQYLPFKVEVKYTSVPPIKGQFIIMLKNTQMKKYYLL